MTNTVTPPPELVDFWVDLLEARSDQAVFTLAAQWGYKQAVKELETVLKEIVDTPCNNSMTDHPITLPPELVQQWFDEARDTSLLTHKIEQLVAVRAAQWGSDQELEACCEWLDKEGWSGESRQLRADRRPKPPSLKEQALQAQQRMWDGGSTHEDWQLIRRALEALPND